MNKNYLYKIYNIEKYQLKRKIQENYNKYFLPKFPKKLKIFPINYLENEKKKNLLRHIIEETKEF